MERWRPKHGGIEQPTMNAPFTHKAMLTALALNVDAGGKKRPAPQTQGTGLAWERGHQTPLDEYPVLKGCILGHEQPVSLSVDDLVGNPHRIDLIVVAAVRELFQFVEKVLIPDAPNNVKLPGIDAVEPRLGATQADRWPASRLVRQSLGDGGRLGESWRREGD